MRIEYIPLLKLQRDVYRMPRGFDRFKHYLQTMVNDTGDDLSIPPLVIINPMAREHVPELLDQYLALNADQVAASAVAEVESELASVTSDFRMSLVIADDLKGGWTNRYATEFGLRCGVSERSGAKAVSRAMWLAPVLWSSEPADLTTVQEEVMMAAFRSSYRLQHGPARTVAEMLAQEGYCMAKAGCARPMLDDEEIEYTREVIAPHLEARDMPTAIACLFGDAGAQSLGFQSYGLSHRAGLALALHDALKFPEPERLAHDSPGF